MSDCIVYHGCSTTFCFEFLNISVSTILDGNTNCKKKNTFMILMGIPVTDEALPVSEASPYVYHKIVEL